MNADVVQLQQVTLTAHTCCLNHTRQILNRRSVTDQHCNSATYVLVVINLISTKHSFTRIGIDLLAKYARDCFKALMLPPMRRCHHAALSKLCCKHTTQSC